MTLTMIHKYWLEIMFNNTGRHDDIWVNDVFDNVVKIWAPSYIRSGSFAVLTLEKDIWDQGKNHFIAENY